MWLRSLTVKQKTRSESFVLLKKKEEQNKKTNKTLKLSYFHTHLLLEIECLVADWRRGGGRCADDSAQQLRFEGDRLQTGDA